MYLHQYIIDLGERFDSPVWFSLCAGMDVFVKYTSELYQMDRVSYMFGSVCAPLYCSISSFLYTVLPVSLSESLPPLSAHPHHIPIHSPLFLLYLQWVPSTSLAPWNDCAQSAAQLCLLCIVKCFPVSSAKSCLSDTRMAFWDLSYMHCLAIAMKSCFPQLCSSTKILALNTIDLLWPDLHGSLLEWVLSSDIHTTCFELFYYCLTWQHGLNMVYCHSCV